MEEGEGLFSFQIIACKSAQGAKKVEVKYISAQDRKEQMAAASSSNSSSVIFDMRGPNARILQTEQVSGFSCFFVNTDCRALFLSPDSSSSCAATRTP